MCIKYTTRNFWFSFFKQYWFLIFCLTLIAIQFPLAYFSLNPIAGNDIEGHTAQARLTNSFFHTWWNENGLGGSPSNIYYPPLILLFSWSPLLLKIIFFLSLLSLPLLFYRVTKYFFKDAFTSQFSTLLFTYFLFDQTHSIYFASIGGVKTGLFSYTLALSLFFVYWIILLRKKNASFLLALIVLTNPIIGIMGVILTFIYVPLKKIIRTGVVSICLTAWWLVPYIYFGFFERKVGGFSQVTSNYVVHSLHQFSNSSSFILTTHTVPIIILGVLGLLVCNAKKLHIFFATTVLLIVFKVVGWQKRLTQFILLILCLYAGYLFIKFSHRIKYVFFALVMFLLLYSSILSISPDHQLFTSIYNAPLEPDHHVDTQQGYYFSLNPPYQYYATEQMKIAFVPFTRSPTNRNFMKLVPLWMSKNSSEFEYIYNYYHITYLGSPLHSLVNKYDFIEPTSDSFIKKVIIKDRYPIFVLNSSKQLDEAMRLTLEVNKSRFERVEQTALYTYQNSVDDCVSSYNHTNNNIEYNTSCIGKPHVIKVTYHPLWRIEGSEGKLTPFGIDYMILYPQSESVKLTFGPNWWMIILYVLALVTLSFLVYSKRTLVMKCIKK